jgi:hypothetical protein
MFNEVELTADRPCQHINGRRVPCVVVESHWEALARLKESERVRKENSAVITSSLAEIERLNGLLAERDKAASAIKAVHEKFEHLGHLFEDKDWMEEKPMSQALAELWAVIKQVAGLEGK